MRIGSARAWVGMVVLLLGISLMGCDKEYRQVVVVDGDKAEYVTFGRAPKKNQDLWVPNRVLVFRTNSAVPGAPTKAVGTAGRVYRLNDALEMEEVGEFDLKIPNDTLAYRYGGG